MRDITSRVVDLLGVGLTRNGQASLTSDTALAAAGTRTAFGAAGLTADVSLQATARAGVLASLAASFDTSVSAAATAVFRSPQAVITADSSVTASGGVRIGATGAFSGLSTLTATGTMVTTASAALSGSSVATAEGDRFTFGTVTMAADMACVITSSPTRVTAADASLTSEGAFTSATGVAVRTATAALSGGLASMQGTPSPVFRLRMATAKRSITDDWLLKRYPIDAGLSLVVKNGVVTEMEVPSQTELAEADYYFLGGRNNPITPAQRATLIAAGFGSYIEED